MKGDISLLLRRRTGDIYRLRGLRTWETRGDIVAIIGGWLQVYLKPTVIVAAFIFIFPTMAASTLAVHSHIGIYRLGETKRVHFTSPTSKLDKGYFILRQDC